MIPNTFGNSVGWFHTQGCPAEYHLERNLHTRKIVQVQGKSLNAITSTQLRSRHRPLAALMAEFELSSPGNSPVNTERTGSPTPKGGLVDIACRRLITLRRRSA